MRLVLKWKSPPNSSYFYQHPLWVDVCFDPSPMEAVNVVKYLHKVSSKNYFWYSLALLGSCNLQEMLKLAFLKFWTYSIPIHPLAYLQSSIWHFQWIVTMLNVKGRLTFQPFNKTFSPYFPYLSKNLRMSVIVHENGKWLARKKPSIRVQNLRLGKHLPHYHLLELGDQFGIWKEAFEGERKCIEIFLATKKDCIWTTHLDAQFCWQFSSWNDRF